MENHKRTLSVFLLVMINVAAVCNIKNFPLISIYGFSALFFLVLAALIFFIPVSLVSAELATGWPKRGVYIWVREAMGPRFGFLAIWLQWILNIIWFPTLLSFIAATFAYMFDPKMADNKFYVMLVVLVTFWAFTFINFLGMKISGWVSSISTIFGTLVPSAFIIILAIVWFIQGNPMQIPLNTHTIFPSLTSIGQLVIFAGILLTLAGMEMSAVHALEVKHPSRDYPRAILISTIMILILYALGSLAVAIVVPAKELNLASGSMEAFTYFLDKYDLKYLVPVVAFAMTIGGLGMLSTWIVGPTKGIFASALDGDLPPLFQKTNAKGMPVNLLIAQALIVTVLSLVFLFMPSVSSSYWILINLTVQLYLLMYVLMFISAIILRYKQPHVERAYKIPGGNAGMWIVSGIGLIASILTFIIGFVPPSQITVGKLLPYESFLIGMVVLCCILPYILFAFHKPSWKSSHHV